MKNFYSFWLLTLLTLFYSADLKASCATGTLTLVLNLDNNPTQVNWEIKNTANTIVAWSGGVTYTASDANQTIIETIPSIPNGDYTLTVYDAGGDGLCCSNGNGSFQLLDGSNSTILQGSIYEYSSLQAFCLNTTSNFAFDLLPPSTPVLSASNVTSTTVDLSWTASTDNIGVSRYGVFYNDVYFGDLTNTSVTAPIPNGVTDIFVVARDEIGNFSGRSNTITVMPTNGVTTTVFSQGYFENGWDDWFDGGRDCYRYNGTNFSSEGTYSIRLRDNSGRRSAMTSKAFDFTQYDSVRVQFAYYHRNFENGEDFFIKLRENGAYNTVASFSKPTDFNANGFYSVNVLLKASEFTFESNSRLRIQSDASTNNDQIYIDQVILTGYSSSGSSQMRVAEDSPRKLFTSGELVAVRKPIKTEDLNLQEDLIVFPNPAIDYIQLGNIDLEEIKNLQIHNLEGRLLTTLSASNGEFSIKDYQSGLYILKINLKDGKAIMKKILKK